MLLGKRPLSQMTRTTSLSEIGVDLSSPEEAPATSVIMNAMKETQKARVTQQGSAKRIQQSFYVGGGGGFGSEGFDYRIINSAATTAFPRTTHRNNSNNFFETHHFLKACNLCKHPLGPDRDIYMYRGDRAFCSLDCRQHQINQDERKEKLALTLKKASSTTTKSGSFPLKG